MKLGRELLNKLLISHLRKISTVIFIDKSVYIPLCKLRHLKYQKGIPGDMINGGTNTGQSKQNKLIVTNL